jgi:hypothetical protein
LTTTDDWDAITNEAVLPRVPEPDLAPHEFVASDQVPADELNGVVVALDTTEWCASCGWHRDHPIHRPAAEKAAPDRITSMQTIDGIPRRCRLDLLTPVELIIRSTIDAVEHLGADVRLTDAVVLLSQAGDKVADFIEATPALASSPGLDRDAYLLQALLLLGRPHEGGLCFCSVATGAAKEHAHVCRNAQAAVAKAEVVRAARAGAEAPPPEEP